MRGLLGPSAQPIAVPWSAVRNLIPQLGRINLKELTAGHLDNWLDERAEELSTRTLRLGPDRRGDASAVYYPG